MHRLIFSSVGVLLVVFRWAQADPLLDIMQQEEGFAGVVLVGDETGQATFRATGFADDAAETPFAKDDIWRWASVTKQLIGVLIMQEVEAGRLSLDDTLAERLPEAKTRHAKTITIKNLLQHTSGMRPPSGLPPEGADRIDFCASRALRKPGERFAYNGCETVLAAEILSRSAGKNWRTLMKERIFDPAGMMRTAAKLPGEGRAIVGGYLADGSREGPFDVAVLDADGSVIGPATDLALFDAAMMRGDLLSDESREILWTGAPKFGFVALGVWSFSAPLDGCGSDPVALVERRGALFGVQARNFIVPERNISLIAFTNRQAFDFGEVWTGQGFSYELLSEAVCKAAQ
ncbi:MAG: serine hydrolase domain-containing protein [Pseudomonadota bacterium]